MSIVDGKGLITWEGGLFTPDSALLPRVRWAFAQIRADGGTISLNEAGRPVGVPSDQYARNSADTESGRSTVWFQWGRMQRGETPEAADPRSGNVLASEHTQGIAIDCDAAQPGLRAKYFAMVGLKNTIASERWHWAIRGPSTVDLASYAYASNSSSNWESIMTKLDDDDREFIKGQMADVKGYVRTLFWGNVDNETDSFAHFVGTNVHDSQEAVKSWNRDLLWGNVVTPEGATTPSLTGFIGDNIKGSQEAIIGKIEKP